MASQPGAPVGLLTRDAAMLALLADLARAARTCAPILLEGESGTGKELLARHVHAESGRTGRFIPVNCAAVPEALLESEMFGHERGAFTGAVARRVGRFEAAHGGTLLLDEITEMPRPLQAKLLRALQDGEIQPLGTSGSLRSDARVVATTNVSLAGEVQAGRFRLDLFYRLHVIPVKVPALRDRPGDIGLLAHSFVQEYAAAYGCPAKGLSVTAMRLLERHDWPGNVRELQNTIQRIVLSCPVPIIPVEYVLLESEAASAAQEATRQAAEGRSFREMERDFILATIERAGGNRTRAARVLGVSVRTIRNKLALYRAQAAGQPLDVAGRKVG